MHVWQRGNHQEQVFASDAERRMFLSILWRQSHYYGVSVAGHCLMSNHYHLVVVGELENSVSRAVGMTNQEYSAFKHRKDGRRGQLWQGRFGSTLLDEAHYWAALCYVERNPVKAGLVPIAWEWEWSSARAHLGMVTEDGLDFGRWRERYDVETWKRALEVGIYDAALEERMGRKIPVARLPGESGVGGVVG